MVSLLGEIYLLKNCDYIYHDEDACIDNVMLCNAEVLVLLIGHASFALQLPTLRYVCVCAQQSVVDCQSKCYVLLLPG